MGRCASISPFKLKGFSHRVKTLAIEHKTYPYRRVLRKRCATAPKWESRNSFFGFHISSFPEVAICLSFGPASSRITTMSGSFVTGNRRAEWFLRHFLQIRSEIRRWAGMLNLMRLRNSPSTHVAGGCFNRWFRTVLCDRAAFFFGRIVFVRIIKGLWPSGRNSPFS